MYGHTSAAAMMVTGLIAANSGWSVTGWCLLAFAAVLVTLMTVSRVARKNRDS